MIMMTMATTTSSYSHKPSPSIPGWTKRFGMRLEFFFSFLYIMRLCVVNENNDIELPTSHTITNRLGWMEARDATCLEPQVSFFFILNDCSIRLLCHGIGTTSSLSDHHHTPVRWADDGESLATIYDHMHGDALSRTVFSRTFSIVLRPSRDIPACSRSLPCVF